MGTKKQRTSWQPNEHLRRQLALQTSMGAPYVAVVDNIPNVKTMHIPLMVPHNGARLSLERSFERASASGSEHDIAQAWMVIKQNRLIDMEGAYELCESVLRQQLEKEFGCSLKDIESRQTAAAKAAVESAADRTNDPPLTERPSLYECLSENGRSGRSGFYPASPSWINDPERFWGVLVAFTNDPNRKVDLAPQYLRFLFDSALHSAGTQRAADGTARLLNEAYKDKAHLKMTLVENERIYRSCAAKIIPLRSTLTKDALVAYNEGLFSFESLPDVKPTQTVHTRCDHCHIRIDLAEPPMCACGEIYCSIECHKRDWKAHRSVCEAVLAESESALFMTQQYWRFVLEGAMPWIGGVKDWRTIYQTTKPRGISELDFYCDHGERDELQARLTAAQRLRDEAVAANKPLDAAMMPIIRELMTGYLAYSTPHPFDSADRLRFKLMILTVYLNLKDTCMLHLPMDNMAAITASFRPYMNRFGSS